MMPNFKAMNKSWLDRGTGRFQACYKGASASEAWRWTRCSLIEYLIWFCVHFVGSIWTRRLWESFVDTSMDLKVIRRAFTIYHWLKNDIFEHGSTLEAPWKHPGSTLETPLQDPFRASVPRKKIFARPAPNPGSKRTLHTKRHVVFYPSLPVLVTCQCWYEYSTTCILCQNLKMEGRSRVVSRGSNIF